MNLKRPTPGETNTMRVPPGSPVVAVDIDGTLGDYHNHLKWFAELYLQEPVRDPVWSDTDEFEEALGLDKHTYRQVKLAYRQGGMKRIMPVIDAGVHDLILGLRRSGVAVWICTTRPWLRLDNIDPDTRFWLNRNVGRVDGLIFGEEKYEDLVDIVGRENIIGIVDDLPENIRTAHELGLRTVLRAGAHNKRHQHMLQRECNTAISMHSIDTFKTFMDWKYQ